MDFWFDLIETLADAVLTLLEEFPINRLTRRGRMLNARKRAERRLTWVNRKREKEEAVMIGRYMELYEGWQVDVSEWRLKNNYHRLTDARAGKFAKEKAGKIPAQKEKKCI